MRPLLVGEANPYSRDSEDALLPWPERATGDRLARVLNLSHDGYLARFDRCNLCLRQWSLPAARVRAAELLADDPERPVVMLGRRVAAAFAGRGARPQECWTVVGRLYSAPHPSGLSRVWNDRAAPGRVRALLAPLLASPVTLLVRRLDGGCGRWVRFGGYETEELAADAWRARIEGRGVTAWSWWGPTEVAERALLDPGFPLPDQGGS